MHDAPREQEQHEQHDEAVDVGGVAEDVEGEVPEHRPHHDALQAIGAAGELSSRLAISHRTSATPSVTISRVRSEPRSTRKLVTKPSTVAAQAGDEQRQHRLLDDAVLGEEARDIGAEAEERRVAERDDAGIAEQQVEREREQAEDRDLGEDQVLGSAAGRSIASASSQKTISSALQRARAARIA